LRVFRRPGGAGADMPSHADAPVLNGWKR